MHSAISPHCHDTTALPRSTNHVRMLALLICLVSAWIMAVPVYANLITDNFTSSTISYDAVRLKESDINNGWQANSNAQAGQGYPQSAWTISGGTLSNASAENNSGGEGGVAQVISVTGDGTDLILSFDYSNTGNDMLYVHLWGFTGILSGDDDNIGNFQANNGHYYNNAEDVDGVGNVNTYNLKDGSNPAGGSPANALASLTGSGRYSITIPLADLGIAGVTKLSDFGYLSLAFTRNAGSSPGTTGIDNLELRYEPVAPPPPPPSPEPSQLRNYGYLYFENGYPTTFNTRRPQSEANSAARANPDLVFQTGYFSLLFDCNDIRLKGYDGLAGSNYRAALEEDVTTFTPAQNLLLRVYQNGIAYDCVSAVVAGNGFNNVRLIENGQYVQRIDHLGLVFKAANGDTLISDPNCRLEITAWPDRVTLLLDFSAETTNPITRTTIRVISPSGTSHLADTMAHQVRLSLKPQEDLKLGTLNPAQYITTATNLQNSSPLAVSFDADTHAFHIDVPADPVSYPADINRIDEYLVEVTNPTASKANIPLVFDQPVPRKITGTVMLLADETDGRPLGVPVQISKNWHRDANNPSPHEGSWLRGSTMLTLEPGESRRFKLRVVYGYWGSAGAVSHAQLSLIGWGGNWKWEESALGAWGESITFDPAHHIAGSFMGDIRPTFTDSYSAKGPTHGWTENCGGADFLIYRDSANTYRWGKRLKTCFHRTGPNLTEVIYGGLTDDERIRFTYTAKSVSTHDYHRRFSQYRYQFLDDVISPQRLVFHQMAADYYMVPSYGNYYLGDETGMLESRVIDAGGNTYKGSPIPFDGKWLSIDDTTGGGKDAKALRGLMSLSSNLNGTPLPTYLHTYGRTWGSSTMLFDLAGSTVRDSYNAGDVVTGELAFVMPPQHRDNYWGGDNELINRLNQYGETAWEPVRDEWLHNVQLDVSMESGTLLRSYPLEIQPQSNDSVLADFTINGGGIGHLPVIIQDAAAGQELKVQRWNDGNWTDLEGVDLAGNAYYQGVLNPDGSMDYIFSIPRPSLDLNATWRVRIVDANIVIPNDPPAFTADPITEIDGSASSPYQSSLADDASDPESDTLTFSKLAGPAWLDVAADGTLTGTPGPADVDLNTFIVQVSDGASNDTTTLQITVVADPLASVAALGNLTDPPLMYVDDSSSNATAVTPGELKAIYFEGEDYQGSPTRVYAHIGLPAGASAINQVPGVVLVHGGGGTAYSQWVQLWTDRGYAAISIAVEGQTDIAATQAQKDAGLAVGNWLKHAMPGPARVGVYGDSNVTPISDQWMYHAVADTVLANSLLRSLPEVAGEEVGLMGISWGGVVTSTAIGIDPRFAFAVPVYGCGSMADAGNWWGVALGNNDLYKNVWDPMVRIGSVTQPMLWLSWPEDAHFPLDSQADCYRTAPGPRMVSLIPGMGHGHSPAWNRSESYAFADSIINDGTPWCLQQGASLNGGLATVEFSATKALDQASVIVTLDSGFTGSRTWTETTAILTSNGSGSYTVTAPIPDYATAWFINVHSGSLVASSDYQETPETFTLSYSAGPNGSISGSNPQAVRYGSDGSAVTAVPDTGYHFVNWSDGSTVNPRIDTGVVTDINITANFAIDTFTLSYTAGPNGFINGTTQQMVEYGANGSEVTAVPDAGYHFVDWSDGSTANPRTDINATSDIETIANFEIDPPVGDWANAETTLLGIVSAGTINDTHESDNVYQVLTEAESGGRRNRRRSQLEHKWVFDVTGGELVTFFVEAHHSANSERDDFLFSYSIDDLNYSNMLTVTKTADDDTTDFYILPGDLSGIVYVRVVDTDRTQGNNTLDHLYIDNLLIVSESASEPPAAAAGPNPADGAIGVPMNNTVLSWTPGLLASSHNVYFGINPAPGSTEFQSNVAASIFTPGELAANTTYYWAIDGVNSAGTTQGPVWSFTTSGLIPEMHVSAIDLGLQRKGKSYSGVVTVRIVDSATGQPVAGASVQGDFSGVFNGSASALTDASGEATLSTSAKERLPLSYTFTVTGINAAAYLYQPASNTETSDSGSF